MFQGLGPERRAQQPWGRGSRTRFGRGCIRGAGVGSRTGELRGPGL